MPLLLPATPLGWGGLLVSYLLGAIPFGLVLGYLVRGVDVRAQGSGNIGATNVGRALGRPWAIVAFLLDAAKGWAPALFLPHAVLALGAEVESEWSLRVLYGFAAVCGHVWPVYLGFKGGKGVATFFGVLFAGFWPIGLLAGVIWLAMAAIFRFSSLAALAAAAAAPLAALIGAEDFSALMFCGFLAVLIFIRHKQNIERLLAGTEPKIGANKAAAEGTPPPAAPDESAQTPP